MSNWSSDREGLARIEDAVKELSAVVVASYGGTPKVKFARRPETAVERVRARNREREHLRLVHRVLPHKATESN